MQHARPHLRVANVKNAELAGQSQLKIYHTVNIKMWRHPKYYKELRKLRNNLDQAISRRDATAAGRRSPGPGLKLQASSDSQVVNQVKLSSQSQASSSKRQASSKPKPEPSSGSSNNL